MSPESRNTRDGKNRPRHHLPPPGEEPGAWALQHDPFTIEGELEGLARFARGARTTRSRKLRAIAWLVVIVFFLPIVIGLVTTIVHALS